MGLLACVVDAPCSLLLFGIGGKQGNKIGKGKGGGGQKKKSPAAGQASSKQRTAPVIQTYAFPSSSSSSDSSGSGGNGGGIRALVGRNSRQNDHVTFSLAKPHELWFHAQGVPGSHVLLRFDAGTEVCVGCGCMLGT